MATDRAAYKHKYYLMRKAGLKIKAKYKAVKDTEIRHFESLYTLSVFLGYGERQILRYIKQNKTVLGWKLSRIKWFEEETN